eukprot:31312-Pelagococcus_subviridis.AAC.20
MLAAEDATVGHEKRQRGNVLFFPRRVQRRLHRRRLPSRVRVRLRRRRARERVRGEDDVRVGFPGHVRGLQVVAGEGFERELVLAVVVVQVGVRAAHAREQTREETRGAPSRRPQRLLRGVPDALDPWFRRRRLVVVHLELDARGGRGGGGGGGRRRAAAFAKVLDVFKVHDVRVRDRLEAQTGRDRLVVRAADLPGGVQRRLPRAEPLRGLPEDAIAPRRRPLLFHLKRRHVRLRGVSLAEPEKRVAVQTRARELVRLEHLRARGRAVGVVLGADLGDHVVHAFLRRFSIQLLLRPVQAVLAPVVQVAHPHDVMKRLHALELLAKLAPGDDLREVVVSSRRHVVVRGEVRVDEAQRRVPRAARDPDAALVVHDVPDPGRFRGLLPEVERRRGVDAHESRDAHLPQHVDALQGHSIQKQFTGQ